MLTHEIVRYKPPNYHVVKEGKPKLVVGSNEHRAYILARNLAEVFNTDKYDPGSTVRAKGKRGTGIVINIEEDMKCVEWDGLKVKFIEVWFETDNSFELFHPSELRT